MINEKIWAEKNGFLVLRDGSIYTLNYYNTGKCVEVKQRQDKDGYLRFSCNGKPVIAHRFIASCFIPNPQNLPQINHKDEDKQNNCVKNLEWVTAKYNTNYGSRNKKAGETNSKVQRNDPKKSKKVYQYTLDGVFVKEWASTKEIKRVLGYANQHISDCCNGKQKSAYGFVWKHAN